MNILLNNKIIGESKVSSELQKAANIPFDSIFNSTFEANAFLTSIIDLTTLEGSDNTERIIQLCAKAEDLKAKYQKSIGAICVYPTMAAEVRNALGNESTHIACVSGAFPSGQSPLDIRIMETKYAIQNGANEIDMVISRGKFLENDYEFVFNEVNAFRVACGKDVHLKVILETGELKNNENIHKASMIAMQAGADFIKTSTGKIPVGATLESMAVMLLAIKEFYTGTGKKIGIKPAGGISNIATAQEYIKLVYSILGNEWLTPELFRIGASRLADELLTSE